MPLRGDGSGATNQLQQGAATCTWGDHWRRHEGVGRSGAGMRGRLGAARVWQGRRTDKEGAREWEGRAREEGVGEGSALGKKAYRRGKDDERDIEERKTVSLLDPVFTAISFFFYRD